MKKLLAFDAHEGDHIEKIVTNIMKELKYDVHHVASEVNKDSDSESFKESSKEEEDSYDDDEIDIGTIKKLYA